MQSFQQCNSIHEPDYLVCSKLCKIVLSIAREEFRNICAVLELRLNFNFVENHSFQWKPNIWMVVLAVQSEIGSQRYVLYSWHQNANALLKRSMMSSKYKECWRCPSTWFTNVKTETHELCVIGYKSEDDAVIRK